MQTTDKVANLLGFAIKAGKVIFGSDSIERYHKKKHLIIMCTLLSENTQKKIVNAHQSVPVFLSRETKVEDLTHKAGCKVIAVTDKQMATALIDKMNGSYQRVTEVR